MLGLARKKRKGKLIVVLCVSEVLIRQHKKRLKFLFDQILGTKRKSTLSNMESDAKVCSCNGIDGELSDCISKSLSTSESTDNSGDEDVEIVRNTSISEGEIEDLTIGHNEEEKVATITELRKEEEMLLEKHMRIRTQNKRKYYMKDENDDSDDFQLTKSSRRRRMKVGDNSGGQEICSTRKFSVHDEKALQAKKVHVRLLF